jgi:hypothetical protein
VATNWNLFFSFEKRDELAESCYGYDEAQCQDNNPDCVAGQNFGFPQQRAKQRNGPITNSEKGQNEERPE